MLRSGVVTETLRLCHTHAQEWRERRQVDPPVVDEHPVEVAPKLRTSQAAIDAVVAVLATSGPASARELAERTERSEFWTGRALADLVDLGLVTRARRGARVLYEHASPAAAGDGETVTPPAGSDSANVTDAGRTSPPVQGGSALAERAAALLAALRARVAELEGELVTADRELEAADLRLGDASRRRREVLDRLERARGDVADAMVAVDLFRRVGAA